MKELIKEFEEFEKEIYLLKNTSALLYFDKTTIMPEKSSNFRDEQMSYFALKEHQILTSKRFQELIEELSQKNTFSKLDNIIKNKVIVYKKKLKKIVCLPDEFVKEFEKIKGKSYNNWVLARENNDYNLFKEDLRKVVEFSIKKAKYINPKINPYDVLLDDYEEGMRVKDLKIMFSRLKEEVIEILSKIKKSSMYNHDNIFKGMIFKKDTQKEVLEDIFNMLIKGDNKKRFTWSQTIHPFMIRIEQNDVRICNAIKEDDPMFSFLGCSHECGHALYELSFPNEYSNSVLMDRSSLGMHESQSKFWENYVFLSKSFWSGYFEKYRNYFKDELKDIDLDSFYRNICKVKSSLIRVKADEITYILHIIIRFELELNLIEGNIGVDELPELWNKKLKKYLGIEPKNIKEGVLQDIHWSEGVFGYFPTYTLGSIYATMYDSKLKEVFVDYEDKIYNRELDDIIDWLKENISKYTNTKLTKDIIKKACSKEIDIECYINYLKNKYYELYNIED